MKKFGKFELKIFENKMDRSEHYALIKGRIKSSKAIRVRVISTNILNNMINFNQNTLKKSLSYLSRFNNYALIIIKDQNLNSMLSLPFFLFIMTALSSILTMGALKQSNNFTFIVVGIIACVAIYYFKDLSLALGQTDRISLSLSAWIPVVTIGLLSSIGILQINEK